MSKYPNERASYVRYAWQNANTLSQTHSIRQYLLRLVEGKRCMPKRASSAPATLTLNCMRVLPSCAPESTTFTVLETGLGWKLIYCDWVVPFPFSSFKFIYCSAPKAEWNLIWFDIANAANGKIGPIFTIVYNCFFFLFFHLIISRGFEAATHPFHQQNRILICNFAYWAWNEVNVYAVLYLNWRWNRIRVHIAI